MTPTNLGLRKCTAHGRAIFLKLSHNRSLGLRCFMGAANGNCRGGSTAASNTAGNQRTGKLYRSSSNFDESCELSGPCDRERRHGKANFAGREYGESETIRFS
jgi:hypothetical protein